MEPKLDELIKNLEHEDKAVRMFAAEDLGFLNDPAAIPVLIKHFVSEKATSVREAIGCALKRIDEPRIVELTLDLLKSEDAYVRNFVVELFCEKGEQHAEYLLDVLNRENDQDVRKFIVDAAAEFTNSAAVPFIHLGIEDPDVNVRIAAVEYVGQKELTPLLPDIETVLLNANEPMLIAACLEALTCIGNWETLLLLQRKFPNLHEVEPVYLVPLLSIYGKHATPEHLEALERLLEAASAFRSEILAKAIVPICVRHEIAPLSDKLLAFIKTLLEDKTDTCTDTAKLFIFLGTQTGDARIKAFLQKLLASSNKFTRMGAISALSAHGNGDTAKQLQAMLDKENDPDVKEALRNALRT